MAAARGLLAPGESVVLDLHPHGRALVRPLLLIPVTVGLAVFAATLIPSWHAGARELQGWSRLAVGVLAAGVLARTSLIPWLVWRSRRYVLTTGRIVLREGVLRRRSRDIPLGRVNDVSVDAGVVDRLFRSGTLVVESGGEHGSVVLTAVPRVGRVARTVQDLVAQTPRSDPWRPTPV